MPRKYQDTRIELSDLGCETCLGITFRLDMDTTEPVGSPVKLICTYCAGVLTHKASDERDYQDA